MNKAAYIPWADTASQNFAKTYPGSYMGAVTKFLLHTTEGSSWPGYDGGASAPNVTLMPDWSTKTVRLRQHFPAGVAARALRNLSGGIETNREGVFQMEIVGTDGWATVRNPSRDYTLGEQWYVPNYPQWVWEGVARVFGWLHREWGVPIQSAPQGFGAWNTGARKFTPSEWSAFEGLCGHQHVLENDHDDPGLVPVDLILKHARIYAGISPAGTPKPSPTTEKDVLDMDEKTLEAIVERAAAKAARAELERFDWQPILDPAKNPIAKGKVIGASRKENYRQIQDKLDRTEAIAKRVEASAKTILDLLKGKK